MGKGLPGPAGDVGFPESAGEAVEVFRGAILAFAERESEGGLVAGDLAEFLAGGREELVERRERAALGGIENVFSDPAVTREAFAFQEGKSCGNAGLGHAEDFLELSDRKLVLRKHEEDPEPRRVRENTQKIYN
jgi:hypothetical protein